jgi:hypothetical protein
MSAECCKFNLNETQMFRFYMQYLALGTQY